jgi:hypothetical protein
LQIGDHFGRSKRGTSLDDGRLGEFAVCVAGCVVSHDDIGSDLAFGLCCILARVGTRFDFMEP